MILTLGTISGFLLASGAALEVYSTIKRVTKISSGKKKVHRCHMHKPNKLVKKRPSIEMKVVKEAPPQSDSAIDLSSKEKKDIVAHVDDSPRIPVVQSYSAGTRSNRYKPCTGVICYGRCLKTHCKRVLSHYQERAEWLASPVTRYQPLPGYLLTCHDWARLSPDKKRSYLAVDQLLPVPFWFYLLNNGKDSDMLTVQQRLAMKYYIMCGLTYGEGDHGLTMENVKAKHDEVATEIRVDTYNRLTHYEHCRLNMNYKQFSANNFGIKHCAPPYEECDGENCFDDFCELKEKV